MYKEIEKFTDKENAFKNGYDQGFNDCKKLILRLLKENWTGLDMSINSCDEYYIEKIRGL